MDCLPKQAIPKLTELHACMHNIINECVFVQVGPTKYRRGMPQPIANSDLVRVSLN